jgi:exodeoxyribonuclease-1
VYTSGKYPAEFEKTTVAQVLGDHPKKQGAFVYDLRHDPNDFKALSPEQLAEAWRWKKPDEPGLRLPVKTLQFNRCPAVAPLGVLDAATQARLKLDMGAIKANAQTLLAMKDFLERLREANDILDKKQQTSWITDEQDVDARLYDGFLKDDDRNTSRVVRAAAPGELADLVDNLKDDRLKALLPLYKARNFPKDLSDDERQAWEQFREQRLLGGGRQSRMAKFMARLQDIAARGNLTGQQQYLLEELKLYAESVMPSEAAEDA